MLCASRHLNCPVKPGTVWVERDGPFCGRAHLVVSIVDGMVTTWSGFDAEPPAQYYGDAHEFVIRFRQSSNHGK